jgi:hypothetical protein
VFSENFDGVTPPTLPAGWTATKAIDPDGILWVTLKDGDPFPPFDSSPNAAFVNDPDAISDKRFDSPSIPIQSDSAQLTFRHNLDLESGFDGGALEISIGGGGFQTSSMRAAVSRLMVTHTSSATASKAQLVVAMPGAATPADSLPRRSCLRLRPVKTSCSGGA